MEKFFKVISCLEHCIDENKKEDTYIEIIEVKYFNTKKQAEDYVLKRPAQINKCKTCNRKINKLNLKEKICFNPNEEGYCINNIWSAEYYDCPMSYKIIATDTI